MCSREHNPTQTMSNSAAPQEDHPHRRRRRRPTAASTTNTASSPAFTTNASSKWSSICIVAIILVASTLTLPSQGFAPDRGTRTYGQCSSRHRIAFLSADQRRRSSRRCALPPSSASSSSSSALGSTEPQININGDSINGASDYPPPPPPSASAAEIAKSMADQANPDIPLPTENGGYTHTTASRAKISAANKGKTPWNKGKQRSEEVKARIAAGVRKKNRERFLKKLEEMGLTEEEYEAQKKEERRIREKDRRARRTEKGGYRPTEETKAKISAILKEKWASGQVKKRAPSTGQRRVGFKHTEETKQKIRDSLKKRWATDPEYRANKEQSAREINGSSEARKKIAATLKKKWQDPEFRAYMMEKMAKRKKPSKAPDAAHRRKISEAMKKKWAEDKAYRDRAVGGMKKKAAENPRPVSAVARKKTTVRSGSKPRTKAAAAAPPKRREKALGNGIYQVMPEVAPTARAKKKAVSAARKTRTATKAKTNKTTTTTASAASAKTAAKRTTKAAAAATTAKRKKKAEAPVLEAVQPLTPQSKELIEEEPEPEQEDEDDLEDSDLAQFRNDRRDLYDLLYGDEDDSPLGGSNDFAIYDRQSSQGGAAIASAMSVKGASSSGGRGRPMSTTGTSKSKGSAVSLDEPEVVAAQTEVREPVFSPSLPSFSLEDDFDDDDLDNFDPYGLD